MAVIQEAFDVPDDIMIKLLTGEYRRLGGVVRYAVGPKKGQIVKHLDPIDLKEADEAKVIGAKAFDFVKENKDGLLIGGIIVGVAVVGGYIGYKIKTREPAVLTNFRSSLRRYINEIRDGRLTLKTINNLMASMDELKKHKDFDKFTVELSTEEISVLVNRIYEYTISLAENNGVDLTEEDLSQTDRPIIDLQSYLRVQKRIFETVA